MERGSILSVAPVIAAFPCSRDPAFPSVCQFSYRRLHFLIVRLDAGVVGYPPVRHDSILIEPKHRSLGHTGQQPVAEVGILDPECPPRLTPEDAEERKVQLVLLGKCLLGEGAVDADRKDLSL